MIELLFAYAEKFEENFPIFFVMELPEEEIKELIQQAIDTNKPFKADYIDGAKY